MYQHAPIPEYKGNLRSNLIRLPTCIDDCSGIIVLGKRIKSLLFSTDVAIIRNTNADAIIAVYPFTPQPVITQALILVADVPIFCGIGGGLTNGERSIEVAIHAEFQGALGVVLNKPAPNDLIAKLKTKLEIPVVVTTVSANEDFLGRMRAGVDIFNVSGGSQTAEIVRIIRRVSATVPIIATGGNSDESIQQTILAGANAITYTPPQTSDLMKELMNRYRNEEQ